MNSQGIKSLLRNTFNSEFISSSGMAIAYDNQVFIPPTDAGWIRLSVLFGTTHQVSLGDSKRFRILGIMVADVFGLLDKGEHDTDVLADGVALNFLDRVIIQGSTRVSMQTPTVKTGVRDNAYWKVQVQCPFYSDVIKTPSSLTLFVALRQSDPLIVDWLFSAPIRQIVAIPQLLANSLMPVSVTQSDSDTLTASYASALETPGTWELATATGINSYGNTLVPQSGTLF